MKTDSSEETSVVTAYTTRHDAEIAKRFLADQGIDSFVIADNVHVSLQLIEGVRLVVMQSLAQTAYRALSAANLLPDSLSTDVPLGDDEGEDEEVSPSGYQKAERTSKTSVGQRTVLATAAATLVMMLFYIPWRIDYTDEIMWAPIFRSPISHTTTFQELGRARVHYETGEVAFDILILQVLGVMAAGWIAWVLAGAMAKDKNVDEA